MERIFYKKPIFFSIIFLVFSFFFITQKVAANEITIERTTHLLDSRSPNSVGFGIGDRHTFAVNLTPNGDLDGDGFADSDGTSPPSTVIASQGGVERSLIFYPVYLDPNHFVSSLTYNPLLVNNWDFHITNGSDTAVTFSPDIAGVERMPFVTSMSLTGSGTTPTFNWTAPIGSPHDGVSIWIFDLQDFINQSARNIYIKNLARTDTMFQVPDNILQPNHLYSVAIQLDGYRDLSSSNPLFTRLERRSRSFFDFSTETLPVPDDAPIYLPSVDPFGSPNGGVIYTFDVAVEGGKTVFIDPVVAVGYDYQVGDGDPHFASVQLPEIGDNKFSLYMFDGENYVFKENIMAGEKYLFGEGAERFRVMGIEASSGLDPNNATAFPTALTFLSDGSFTGTMTPIVVTQVDIDIKPGSVTNCFNKNEHGVIPAAIFGASDFNVDDIDVNSLSLQGLAIKMVGKSVRYLVHTDFVNEDEYLDLIVQFEDDDSWTGNGRVLATLTGVLYDGSPIEGNDDICIIP
ncbi:hypothetical protein [Desulfocastanea catecholica]